MLSKGFMIPLSFASLPVISITFFDKKKRSRKRQEEEEIDVPPDGLSIEDLESLDLDQLQSHSEKMSERGMSPGDPGVITILPGWSFIPCITIALPRKGKFGDSLFDTAEDAEIIEGIRKAPLPDTLFQPAREHDRAPKDRDVAEFDPQTDAIIRPDADTESIVTPKVAPPPAKPAKRPGPVMSVGSPGLDDLDLEEKVPDALGPGLEMPDDHLIKPEKAGPDRSTIVPVGMDRDDLDVMLGGGLPRGSIVLIEGKKGSGVEQFVQRLTFGFLQNGVGVTYISTENGTSDFIEQMYGSGFLMANHLLGKKILYIPIDSLIRKERATAGYIDRLIRSPQLLNEVMIIDRLSTMTANDQDENGHLKLLSYLKGAVTKNRTVILVTDEKQNGIETIREEARARMSLTVIEDGPETTHSVHVLKYPESVHEAQQEIRFKIEPGLGMVVQ
jgi:archaeal flagellar protein FlaH